MRVYKNSTLLSDLREFYGTVDIILMEKGYAIG